MKHLLSSLDEDDTRAKRADEEKNETIARMDGSNGQTWKIITTNRDLCRTSWSSRLATVAVVEEKFSHYYSPYEFYWLGTYFTFADRVDKTFSLPIFRVTTCKGRMEKSIILKNLRAPLLHALHGQGQTVTDRSTFAIFFGGEMSGLRP